ncbi:MAG TPA: multidrug efflux SMR transporter [Kiritimatiellia bacterium]|nr:multidrug efflux SMR transporter [Kiritimatiellia bacterium]
MSWFILILAGLLEVTWPIGLKISQIPGRGLQGILLIVVGMSTSLFFLWLAQRTIPIGTAYATWTGIGASGTFLAGILLFGDAASMVRIAGVTLIVSGVVLLKIAHG